MALYAKYKSGDFIVKNNEYLQIDSTSLQPVRFVRAMGMDNLIIMPSDKFVIARSKKMPDYFKYLIVGDTLVITGETSANENGNESERRRMSETVWLHLPGVEMITVTNTAVHLGGTPDSAAVVNRNIQLSASSLFVQPQAAETKMYFGKMQVAASNGSELIFSDNPSNVSEVSCELRNSKLQDAPSASIGSLSIKADQQSTVQLNGDNFRKLNNTKQ